MGLSVAKCRTAQPGAKLQKLTDGSGLQLWVQSGGAPLWRLGPSRAARGLRDRPFVSTLSNILSSVGGIRSRSPGKLPLVTWVRTDAPSPPMGAGGLTASGDNAPRAIDQFGGALRNVTRRCSRARPANDASEHHSNPRQQRVIPGVRMIDSSAAPPSSCRRRPLSTTRLCCSKKSRGCRPAPA